MWTNHERKSALARAMEAKREYVLPARIDDTQLPGLRPSTGYIDIRNESAESFATKIIQKIERSESNASLITQGSPISVGREPKKRTPNTVVLGIAVSILFATATGVYVIKKDTNGNPTQLELPPPAFQPSRNIIDEMAAVYPTVEFHAAENSILQSRMSSEDGKKDGPVRIEQLLLGSSKTHYRVEVVIKNALQTDIMAGHVFVDATKYASSRCRADSTPPTYYVSDTLIVTGVGANDELRLAGVVQKGEISSFSYPAEGRFIDGSGCWNTTLRLGFNSSLVFPANQYSTLYLLIPRTLHITEMPSSLDGELEKHPADVNLMSFNQIDVGVGITEQDKPIVAALYSTDTITPNALSHGDALARNGDVPGAVAQYNKVHEFSSRIVFDPRSRAIKVRAGALYAAGLSLLNRGKVEEASIAYEEAYSIDRTHQDAASYWNILCRVGIRKGHPSKVLDACKRAVEMAVASDNTFLSYQLCPNRVIDSLTHGFIDSVTEVVTPACEHASAPGEIAFGQEVKDHIKVDSSPFSRVNYRSIWHYSGRPLWRFEGTAGQRIAIRLTTDENFSTISLGLLGPDGSYLHRHQGFLINQTSQTESIVLPESGGYTITVYARGPVSRSAPYILRLIDKSVAQ